MVDYKILGLRVLVIPILIVVAVLKVIVMIPSLIITLCNTIEKKYI